MTRRETIVKFLRGENGFSSEQLDAALAVPGVTTFLTRAQSEGVSQADLADRLVAFKQGGGSGLQRATVTITREFDASKVEAAPAAEATLADVVAEIKSLRAAIEESY